MKRSPAAQVSSVRKRHQAFFDSLDVFIKSYQHGTSAQSPDDGASRFSAGEPSAKARR